MALPRLLTAAGAAAGAGLSWGWFEAGWVRLAEREARISGLPPGLDGLRVAHLSDFHLGIHSRGEAAVERAVAWVEERRPDLVCVTGDLLTKAKGEAHLRTLLERLGHPYVVLGNHDWAHSRDPFSRPSAIGSVEHGTLLADTSVEVELRGHRVELAGIDPRSWLARRGTRFPDSDADLRILLCHFPNVLPRLRAGRWHLVLAGHLHAGQIVVPAGRRRRLLLAHVGSPFHVGFYERAGTLMHVSAGLGTTFVPFRFFARPEATELVLRAGTV